MGAGGVDQWGDCCEGVGLVCFGTWGLRFFEEILDCVGCYEAGCEDTLTFLEGLDLVGLAWDWDGDGDTGCLLSARMEVISVSNSTSSGSGDVGTRDVILIVGLGSW